MGNHLEKTKIFWHSGFYGAIELELIANKGLFEFQREYNLSKEPLRMDLLIIRKLSEVQIVNEIGHIFKKYNIVEYKSPEDELSIDDYYKVVGYACLYKGFGEQVNQIPAEELTVSIFRDRYPRELFRILKQTGHNIEEVFPGIYYVKSQLLFDTQIIVTSRLKGEGHRSLRILSHRAEQEDVRAFIKEALQLKTPGDRNNIEAILQVSIEANGDLYDELRRDSGMCDALRNLMKEEIDEERKRARQEGLETGRQEGLETGRQEGLETGRQEGLENLLETIRNLMANMKWTADQAMEAMSIPAEKRNIYKTRL